jgi:hypothetical protein
MHSKHLLQETALRTPPGASKNVSVNISSGYFRILTGESKAKREQHGFWISTRIPSDTG